MSKTYNLETIVVDTLTINYFHFREKNDCYGNPRYRVFIIQPNTYTVIEQIAKTYNVKDWVRSYVKALIH